jgi:DNA-binding response OmpR family regulator
MRRLIAATAACGETVGSVSMRIYVVEDEDLLAEALVFGLTDAGHEVARACNGESALGGLTAADPDVVIVDWQMPGMRGDAVATEVRARRPHTAVVLMSGGSAREDFQVLCQPGGPADCFIQKPFTPRQLMQVIEQAVDRTRARLAAAGDARS